VDAANIGLTGRGKIPVRRQVPPLDELLHRRPHDQDIEDTSQAGTAQTRRRRRNAQDLRIRIPVYNLAPRVGRRMVGLIDDDKLYVRELFQPLGNGLRAADLYQLRAVHRYARCNDAVMDTHGFKGPVGLLQQLFTMHDE